MKQKKLLAFVLAMICLSMIFQGVNVCAAEKSEGVTYYVSSSEGDDSNDGLSEKTPIKSIERVSKLKLTAGDRLLFKTDDVWYGTITLDLSKGSKENPILISSYGEGSKQPSLRYYTGYVLEDSAENVLVLQNTNGVEIKNLDIGWANAGIRMEYNTRGNEYVRIEDCHFHNIHGTTQKSGLKELAFSSGIYTVSVDMDTNTYVAEGYPVKDVYINRCTSYDGGSLTGYTSEINGLYITECIAQNNGYYGCVVTASGGYIDRCVFDNNGTRPMPVGSCGIMFGTEGGFTVKNSIISNQQRQGTDPDGCGIDFEWKCKDIVVENVLFEGNAGVSVMFFTSGNEGDLGENIGTNYDITIKDCKFVNNNTNIGNIGGYEIYSVNAGADRCVIKDCEYVIDYTTETETVDWYLGVGESNIDFEDVTQVETIDETYDPLIGDSDTSIQSGQGQGGLPSYVWLALGIIEGLILIGIVFGVRKIVNKQKGEEKNEA